MKNLKKKLLVLAAIVLLPLIIVGTLIAVVDPFFVYHAPLENAYYIVDNQLEQNPGMAKHFEYDSVMLGSSMTTNFDTAMFDERLGCEMLKLSYNAAYPHDIDKIMQIVTREKDSLKYAFLCVDIANYMYEPGTLSYPYPEHLYDDNIFNDLKYLLSKDVLLDYVHEAYSLAANEVDIKLEGMAFLTEYLAAYGNVEVVYFQDCEEWICNLDNYTDVTHYSKEITDFMTEELCAGENRVTTEEHEERLKKFGRFVKNYDYKTLLEGKE